MKHIDEQQFSDLLNQAYPKLWTIASAILRDKNLAEDAVQDAAITGLRKIDNFEAGTNFTVWMGQIVRFTSLNYLKQRKRRNAKLASVHSVAEPEIRPNVGQPVSDTGDLISGQSEFDDQVAHAIHQLAPEQRACLLLRTIHNLNYEEIADIVGVPKGTAMSHVHRGKSAMRKTLEASCHSSSAFNTNQSNQNFSSQSDHRERSDG
jgi:RNA polymerase sigma-70 factor (ECF subfamily)